MNNFSLFASAILSASSAMAPISMSCIHGSDGITQPCEIGGCHSSGSSYDMSFILDDKMTRFYKSDSKGKGLTSEMIAATNRHAQMMKSFNTSKSNYPDESKAAFSELSNELCKLPFNSVVSSYCTCDDSIDIVFKMDFDINLSLSKFMDDDDSVVFSIHRNKKLLVSNELPLKDVEDRIIGLLKGLKEKYE